MNEDTNYVDPILETNFDDTEVVNPLLPKGNYPVTLLKVEGRKSEAGSYVSILAKTNEAATSVTGDTIEPGLLLRGMIWLTENANNSKRAIDDSIKNFLSACGCRSGRMTPLNQWEGKTVTARIRIRKNKQTGGDENSINGFVMAE